MGPAFAPNRFQEIAMTTRHHHHHLRRRLHRDWRMWAVILLMLAAVMIYVLSLDDSLLSQAGAAGLFG
jgi:hypothetical protein